MKITKDQILSALQTVMDPDLRKDVVTLGMIEDIFIDGSNFYQTNADNRQTLIPSPMK